MEISDNNGALWHSGFGLVLRWIALLPIGLGFLWLIERVGNILVDWVLSWNLGSPWMMIVFVLGGCLFFLAVLVTGGIVRNLTASVAPNAKMGFMLLGLTYVVMQAFGLYHLFATTDSTWPYIISKFEITLVVGFILLFAAGGEPES